MSQHRPRALLAVPALALLGGLFSFGSDPVLAKPPRPRYGFPDGWVFTVDLAGFSAAAAAFRSTAISRLLEDGEVQPLVEKIKERHQQKLKAIGALREITRKLELKPSVGERARQALERLLPVRPEGIRLSLYPLEAESKDAEAGSPEFALLASAVLRSEDVKVVQEVLAELEKLAVEEKVLARSSEGRQKDGAAVRLYTPPGEAERRELGLSNLWYFFDGDDLYIGLDALKLLEGLKAETPEGPSWRVPIAGEIAVAALAVDVEKILELSLKDAEKEREKKTRAVMTDLGLASLRKVAATLGMDGGGFRQTLFLDLAKGPQGFLAAFSASGAEGLPPPVLPAPPPRLIELSGSVDIGKLRAAAEKLKALGARSKEVPEVEEESGPEAGDGEGAEARRLLQDGLMLLAGGWRIAISGPAEGLLPIPQMAAAVAIKDREAMGKLLAAAKEKLEGVTLEEAKHGEQSYTTVKVANNPSPLLPSLALVGDALYLADSPRTLKAVIDGLAGSPGPAAGAPPPPAAFPAGFGSPLLEVAYDTAEIFRVLQERIQPFVQLGLAQVNRSVGGRLTPLLNPAELPRAPTFLKYLGPGRAGAAWGPGGLYLTAISPLGDPLTACSLPLYGPAFVWGYGLGLDLHRAQLEQTICLQRVRRLREALKFYRSSFGGGKRYPSSLAELVSRGLIEDADALLVPSDQRPAVVEYEDADGNVREARASYHYLPDSRLKVPAGGPGRSSTAPGQRLSPFAFGVNATDLELDRGEASAGGGEKTVLLYELNRNDHLGRIVLLSDGSIHHLSEESFKKLVPR